MNKFTFVFVVVFLCTICSIQAKPQAESDSGSQQNNGLSIVVNSVDVNDKILKLNYEIQNNSQHDIWICNSISRRCDFEIFMDEDYK